MRAKRRTEYDIMIISTRGRYALRVIIDLAEQSDNQYIPMKEVAGRQQISLKYLEQILPVLTKNNIIEGIHGKGGGYRLCREPKDYTVGEILRLTEGDLAPVACLGGGNSESCPRNSECRTLPMWKKFDSMVHDFFYGITLEDILENPEFIPEE